MAADSCRRDKYKLNQAAREQDFRLERIAARWPKSAFHVLLLCFLQYITMHVIAKWPMGSPDSPPFANDGQFSGLLKEIKRVEERLNSIHKLTRAPMKRDDERDTWPVIPPSWHVNNIKKPRFFPRKSFFLTPEKRFL